MQLRSILMRKADESWQSVRFTCMQTSLPNAHAEKTVDVMAALCAMMVRVRPVTAKGSLLRVHQLLIECWSFCCLTEATHVTHHGIALAAWSIPPATQKIPYMCNTSKNRQWCVVRRGDDETDQRI